MVNDEPHIEIPVDSNKQSELQHYQELLQGPDLDWIPLLPDTRFIGQTPSMPFRACWGSVTEVLIKTLCSI